MSKTFERAELIRRQSGLSPITGKALKGRLEIHHVIEKANGGSNQLSNKQILPIEEHLLVHFLRSRDECRNRSDQDRELDTVLGRIRELTHEENLRMSQLIFEHIGIRIRLVGN